MKLKEKITPKIIAVAAVLVLCICTFVGILVRNNPKNITIDDKQIALAASIPYADLSDFSLWRSGVYYWTTGTYQSFPSRICLNDYAECAADTKFYVSVSDASYHVLVRELTDQKKFVTSYNLSNGGSFTTSSKTAYLAISLYSPTKDSVLKYEDYQNLFANGFSVMIYMEQDETTAEPDVAETVEETATETSVEESKQETESSESVQETTTTTESSVFNSVWRIGEYQSASGTYKSTSSSVCHVDYDEVKSGAIYQANISDSNIQMVIRELDVNKRIVGSSYLYDGDQVTLQAATAYVGVGLCNPNDSSMTYENYKELFANGFTATFDYVSEAPTVDASEFSTIWRSGLYHWDDGKFVTYDSRISHLDYDPVTSSAVYVANITDSRFQMLVREMDKDNKLVSSHNLKNGEQVTISEKTVKVGISLYCPTSSNTKLSYYEKAYENGMRATFDLVSEPKEEVSEFEKTWRAGHFNWVDGTYSTYAGRICHLDYDEVKSNTTYIAKISNNDYQLLVRQMDNNKKLIKSHNLKNGESAVMESNAVYVGISIYNPSNSKVTYEEYQKLFEDGFSVSFEVKTSANSGSNDANTSIEDVADSTTESSSSSEDGTVDYSKLTSFHDVIVKMLENGEMGTVDVSRFKMKFSDGQAMYDSIIKKDAFLAYKSSYGAVLRTTRNSSNIILTVRFDNMDDGFSARYTKMQEVVEKVKGMLDSKMSDAEKALIINDYIVANSYYTTSGEGVSYASGPLVFGRALCAGYTEAMNTLLKECAGIETYYLSGINNTHAWVFAKLDGDFYHIDPTWGDTRTGSGYMREYFMRNDDEFKNPTRGSSHVNWVSYEVDPTSKSTKYVKWFGHDVKGKMLYLNGYWYFADGTSLKKAKFDGSSMSTIATCKSNITLVSIENSVVTYKEENKTYTIKQ